ncbi:MAG: GGDEF domain-containing protein [Candidatus Cloacimonadota bacterium]|nr:GGDEF domain-containing protein [Candidatus Cloacimonadota bacterium]
MRKFIFALYMCCFLLNLYAIDNVGQLKSSLSKLEGIEKAKILYKLASYTDSIEATEKIEYCAQAKSIVSDLNNYKLLSDILFLESMIYKETNDLKKYSSSIEEYIKVYKRITQLKMEKSKMQISKQIIIRNSFMIGFLIFLNIAFVIFARYRLKTADHFKLEKANIQLEELSRKDPLTSISNRRDILKKIEYETLRFERNKRAFCLVMGDIDHFKSVNDNHGHECGDYILKALVNTIISGLRKQDIVGRWGGEEFILLLPETNLAGGEIAAEKIRKKIDQNKFIYNNKVIPISITFGVSEYSNGKDIESCIKEADTALYRGKSKGRNRVEIFNPKDVLIG